MNSPQSQGRDDRPGMRPDPCTFLFRVDRSVGADDSTVAGRALDVWVGMAERAGWRVSVIADGAEPGAVGVVDVEGIQYSLRVGPRKRLMGIDATGGMPLEKPALVRAVWAEPLVEPELLFAYP